MTPPAPSPHDGTASLDRRLLDALERLGHGLRALSQGSARGRGLTPLQQQALLAVAQQPAVRREVGALAAEFDVTGPTMSDAVAALVRKGLLTRSVGSDARRRVLALTDDGRRLAGELAGWDAAVLDALHDLDEAGKGAALDVLLAVVGRLARTGTIAVARTCTTCRHFRVPGDAGEAAPYRCALLAVPLRRVDLRTDCPEHELAAATA